MRLQAHDIRAAKGKRRLIQINVSDPEQASAAESVGIDIVVNGYRQDWARLRVAAPGTHFCFSLRHNDHADKASVLRGGFDALEAGADSVYCSLSPRFIEVLSREGIPVCAHSGLVPQKARLTGMRGFGKTAAEARAVFEAVKAFENAGAAMVELECLAAPVTALITQATKLSTVSIGSGTAADIQYLFGCDILGEPGRKPRHARAWDDFSAEYARLQDRRKAAFASFRDEALAGSYPATAELVEMTVAEYEQFAEWCDRQLRES